MKKYWLNWVNPYTLSVAVISMVFMVIVMLPFSLIERMEHITTMENSIKIRSPKPKVVWKYRDIPPQTLVFEKPISEVIIYSQKGKIHIEGAE